MASRFRRRWASRRRSISSRPAAEGGDHGRLRAPAARGEPRHARAARERDSKSRRFTATCWRSSRDSSSCTSGRTTTPRSWPPVCMRRSPARAPSEAEQSRSTSFSGVSAEPDSRRARARAFFGLTPEIVAVSTAMLLMNLGENLWRRFLPKYLQSLGAPITASACLELPRIFSTASISTLAGGSPIDMGVVRRSCFSCR